MGPPDTHDIFGMLELPCVLQLVVTIDITSSYESFRSNSPVSIAMKHVSRFNDTSESDVSSKVYEKYEWTHISLYVARANGQRGDEGTSTEHVRIDI